MFRNLTMLTIYLVNHLTRNNPLRVAKDVIFVFISSALVPPSKHGVRRLIAAQIG